MPDNSELLNALRAVIQEEMQTVRQEVRTIVREELKPVNERLTALEAGQQELKKGQAAIEATVNDLRAINRGTHKKIFTQLDAIWNDIKRIDNRLDIQEKKAVQ